MLYFMCFVCHIIILVESALGYVLWVIILVESALGYVLWLSIRKECVIMAICSNIIK